MSVHQHMKPGLQAYRLHQKREHERYQERQQEQRRAANLLPMAEKLAEIGARRRRSHPPESDTRTSTQIDADLRAYCEAHPISCEQRAEDAAQERERLRAIAAPARARRAKAAASKRARNADAALQMRSPGFFAFLEQHGLRGPRG